MGEYITNIQEKVEGVYGQALEDRQKALPNFIGLGPPDLCVLVKSYEPPRFVPGLKATMISSYHWVSGVDTSSTSSIAVYLGSLIDKQERSSFGRGSYKIEGCHFCIYNAFLKMDLHVELGINNSQPTVYSVGLNGERNTVEESFWKETYISSVLRSISPPPPFLRPLKILPALKNQQEETNFLNLCSEHFWQGRKLGGYDGEYVDIRNQDIEGFEVDDSNNLLVQTLVDYFISRNRFEPIISFFEEFKKTEPSVSTIISHALSLMGNHKQSVELMESTLAESPENPSILMAYAESLLSMAINTKQSTSSPGSSEPVNQILLKSLRFVMKSISLKPLWVRGWKLASSILSQLGYLEWSLILLNNAPYLKVDTTTDRIGKSKYARVTPEPEHPNIVTVMEDEELEFDEEPGDDFLKRLTSLSLFGESLEIFGMLVQMYKTVGWLELAERKTKVLDHIAQTARGKQRSFNINTNSSGNIRSSSGAIKSPPPPVIDQKDGHNTSSPVSRAQATEITENTESTTEDVQIPSDANIPKEGLWREEDVTSEGSEIGEEEDDEQQQKEEGSSTTTTTNTNEDTSSTTTATTNEPAPKQKPNRAVFEDSKLIIDNLNEVLESFIQNYGVDSLKEASKKEFVNIDTPSFKAKLPVVEIHRNVELAFHALFQDVKAYQQWREEENSKKELLQSNPTLKQFNHTRTIADWIRLGQLSFRLSEVRDAELIYKMVQHDKFHAKALLGLVQVFEQVGDIRNCILTSSSISKYYSDKMRTIEVNPVVEKSILNIIRVYGLQKVRNIHATINDLAPVINSLFLDSVKWRSFGFDK